MATDQILKELEQYFLSGKLLKSARARNDLKAYQLLMGNLVLKCTNNHLSWMDHLRKHQMEQVNQRFS